MTLVKSQCTCSHFYRNFKHFQNWHNLCQIFISCIAFHLPVEQYRPLWASWFCIDRWSLCRSGSYNRFYCIYVSLCVKAALCCRLFIYVFIYALFVCIILFFMIMFVKLNFSEILVC